MRFTEITNPEDQLALWKLVSDKMWAAFAQQAHPQLSDVTTKQQSSLIPQTKVKSVSGRLPKVPVKGKASHKKINQHKKGPMAPPPKPLPVPKPQQLTTSQAVKQQVQQHQQLAHQIHQALLKKPPAQIQPQAMQPSAQLSTSEVPMNNSYSERDKDDLVMHRRQNPFKPLEIR